MSSSRALAPREREEAEEDEAEEDEASDAVSSPARALRPRARALGASAAAAPAAPGGGSEDDDEASDSGSDFEETLRGKRQPRPRQQQQASRRRRAAAKASAAPAGQRPEPSELFEAVKGGGSAAQSVVDDWLESYKKDQESGFLELFNFIVRSCGCRGVVTLKMLRVLQNSEIIQQLTESFDEGSAEYPLLLNTPVWRRFRQGFCELMAVLVARTQHAVLYDEYLMGSLIALLTGMSDSQVRAFRHTSTLAAMKLMTGLVRVALGVSLQKDNSQRQYEAEQAKGPSCRALEKLEGLLEQHRELQEKQEELENLMNAIFKGVFIHRYRDLMPEIRAICIEELGRWIEHYSNSFLTDSYLKYIGWTLHDKQGEVRLKCLLALQGLYCSQERAARMELFTSRFKERIMSMILDKEPQVAVEAVRLLTVIFQNMDDVLTDLDCASVFPLVFASNRPLAAAAGEFLYKKLLAPTMSARRSAGTRAAFRLLLAFFIESEFHDHASYLVDSLWDCAAVLLKDWQLLTGLLLEDPPVAGFGDREENSLIMFLAAIVRQATEGQPPVGRTSGKKVLSAREHKMQVEDRLRLTQHLIPLLPLLLAKFSADAEKVVYLLEIPRYFDLTLYSSGRLEKHLELLLAQLWDVMEKHMDSEVLEAASRTLHLLCSPELPFYSRADLARSRLVDYLADKFQHEATELFQSPCCLEKEDAYCVAATLKRIAVLHSAHDLTPWNFFEPCIRLLRHTSDTEEIPKQVVTSAISCSYFSLYWELSHLCAAAAASDPLPRQEQLLTLKEKVASFCSLCQNCLVDTDPGVQEQAFVVLTDLLMIFGPHLPYGGHRLLQELVYKPDVALQSQLAGFLVDHVFNHNQAEGSQDEVLQIEQLHQRRRLLAGFCKLIIYGVLELSAATDIFKHYSKSYNDYGDIIKATLNETRQIDRSEWAHTLLLTLQQLLTQLLLEQGPAGIHSATFLEIRDLARRFSLLFGLHQLQNRSTLVALHKDGIKFAFQEQVASDSGLNLVHLPFLELLSEFSPRLVPPDKALLLSYLKKISQAHLSSRGGEEHTWASLLVYQRSLSPQEAAPLPDAPARQKPEPPAKRRHLDESLGQSSASFSSTSGSRLESPLLTSTTLRKKGPSAAQVQGQEDSGSESEFVQSQPPQGRKAPRGQLQAKNRTSLGRQLGRLTLMEVGEAVVEEPETSEEEAAAFGKDS